MKKKTALAEVIRVMPQHAPVATKENEVTVKEMQEILNEQDGAETWSYAKTKVRLERLVTQGKLKKQKRGNTAIYQIP